MKKFKILTLSVIIVMLSLTFVKASTYETELQCLTKAIYHEARGESDMGKEAVGLVILNRVKNPKFPKTICAVVHQGCQFSWNCDGKSDKFPKSTDIKIIAVKLLRGEITDFTRGALYFNAKSVSRKNGVKTIVIGNHIFYSKI